MKTKARVFIYERAYVWIAIIKRNTRYYKGIVQNHKASKDTINLKGLSHIRLLRNFIILQHFQLYVANKNYDSLW